MASTVKRKPLQGVMTIIRFNWHFHAAALAAIAFLTAVSAVLPQPLAPMALLMASAIAIVTAVSLIATWHAYDATGLYALQWLAPWMHGIGRAANIHAGFDETSALLIEKHPDVAWHIFDFYDPEKHTEISIKRARRAHPPEPGTRTIQTSHIPLESGSVDRVILMLAAHEIRDRTERVAFFKEIRRVLAENGKVIFTEHLRDFPNILAYTIGAWHFHPRCEWLATFEAAGFVIRNEVKNNLLITTFILGKDGNTP